VEKSAHNCGAASLPRRHDCAESHPPTGIGASAPAGATMEQQRRLGGAGSGSVTLTLPGAASMPSLVVLEALPGGVPVTPLLTARSASTQATSAAATSAAAPAQNTGLADTTGDCSTQPLPGTTESSAQAVEEAGVVALAAAGSGQPDSGQPDSGHSEAAEGSPSAVIATATAATAAAATVPATVDAPSAGGMEVPSLAADAREAHSSR